MLRIGPMLVILLLFTCRVEGQSIMEIRKLFHEAVLDPEQSKAFYDFLEDANGSNATVKAYKAVSEAMLAQVLWNPFSKMSQVKKYNQLMTMAVEQDADNIEIRFLRLAIEYNLPRFLGYSTHLDEDRDAIIQNISSISMIHFDPSFSRYILYFLDETGLCTVDQMESMKALIDSNTQG